MYPEINQILYLQPIWQDTASEEPVLVHKSRVADRTADQLLIEMPIAEETGRMKWFPIGTKVLTWYFGRDGSQFRFETSVVGRNHERIPLLILALPAPDTITRIQRRNFLRVDAVTEFAFHLVSRPEISSITHTIDVSGGGVAFWCDPSLPIQKGDRIDGWLLLPLRGRIEHAHLIGEVMRVIPPAEKGLKQKVSVKIVEITDQEQSYIVRFCYEKQLEQREMGTME